MPAAAELHPKRQPVALGTEALDSVERVDLFTLDGKTYTIPDQVRANVGLKYIWTIRTKGLSAANNYLLEAMLGEDNYQVLMECDSLTEDQLSEIMMVCRQVVLGEPEVKPPTPIKKRKSASAK